MNGPCMSHLFFLILCLSFILTRIQASDKYDYPYEAPEPFEILHDFCSDCNPTIPQSPDPLVSTTWNSNTNTTKLQFYRVFSPDQYKVIPPDAIHGMDLFFTSKNHRPYITIEKDCSFMIDWGVERAAWFELISLDDLTSNSTIDVPRVTAAISEFNVPYPGKKMPLVRYGNHTYRLETNPQLYEGVRFTWLFFENVSRPIHIQNISLVAKVKPINYTGFFQSSSDELTEAWYTGAYGVRLNMNENEFNSILIERGDRVAIQGDGHPTIDAALVAFSPYKLVANVLQQTDSEDHSVVDSNILAYPLYWTLSSLDYFMARGDIAFFKRLIQDIMKILDARINDFLSNDLDITWFGWDDRIGDGWCFHSKGDKCPREAHLAFAGLVVRVVKDFAYCLDLAKMPLTAQKYKQAYKRLGKRLKSVPEWPKGFGVHAAANAINSGIATREDIDFWMMSLLNDTTIICSFSQFNQYWILQALGNAGYMEHALASIKLCWGPAMKLGRGCFWEQASPEWITFMKDGDIGPTMPSYCHPWSSGVTAWLSHVLGGINPLLPGYEEVVVSPYVSRRYPTIVTSLQSPYGSIKVNATLRETLESKWVVTGIVQSPVPGYFGFQKKLTVFENELCSHLTHAVLNDELINVLTAKDVQKNVHSNEESLSNISEDFVYVRVPRNVDNKVFAFYDAIKMKTKHLGNYDISDYPPFPKPIYPASIINIDKSSQGDGLQSYGRSGHVLLGVNNGTDVSNLPCFIQNVTIKQHGFPGWLEVKREFIGNSRDKKTYLPINNSHFGGTTRALGMIGQDGIGGYCPDLNTFIVDVQVTPCLKEPHYLFISLYFVGKLITDKFAIRVMDLNTLNIVAPTSAIENYTEGVWWTLHYSGSLRLRLMNMQGLHLSAIAFSIKSYNN